MMIDEIFGPILPLYKYKDVSEVINYITENDKPLVV